MKDPSVQHTTAGAAGEPAVETGGGAYFKGAVRTDGGDLAGRDFYKNIINITQQAASAVEEREKQQRLEEKQLAEGILAFGERLRKSASQGGAAGAIYKGLLEYRLGDAGLFFGRDEAGVRFMEKLELGPLTILHAQSGAGKSSFLQAKVSPALLGRGHLPVYLRSYTDGPASDVKRALLPNVNQLQTFKDATLRDFLLAACDVLPQSRIYVLLDQFEEVFTRFAEGVRSDFVIQLAECLSDPGLNVRWVLSLRTDYFGLLADFEPPLRPFNNQYLLDPLKRVEAEEAIVRPAGRAGVRFENGLVNTIINELSGGESIGGLIAPPQLQLVCMALYEGLGGAKHVTRAYYDSLGGAKGILRGYLGNVIRRLPQGDREVARKLLGALVNASQRRVRRTRSELAGERGLEGIDPGIVDSTLARLDTSRLLRVQEDEATGITTYELAHDYLVEQLAIDERVLARKGAQELLDDRIRQYRQHKILLGAGELAIINPHWRELVISEEAEKLIATSARKVKRRNTFNAIFSTVFSFLLLLTVWLVLIAYSSTRTILQADQSMRLLFENNGLVPVAGSPQALAFDGKHMWVASGGSRRGELQAIDPRSGAVKQVVSLEHEPSGLYFDRERLWVTYRDTAALQLVDTQAGKVSKRIGLPAVPLSIVSDGRRLWISLSSRPSALVAFDPASEEINPAIETIDFPETLAFDGKRVWVASRFGYAVQSIDPATDTAQEPIKVFPGPDLLAFDGRRLWLGNKDLGTLITLDPETSPGTVLHLQQQDRVVGDIQFKETLLGLTFEGTKLWVATSSNNVMAVDPETREIGESVKVGSSPGAMAFDGLRLWVANKNDQTVQSLDAATAIVGKSAPILSPTVREAEVRQVKLAAVEGALYVAAADVILPLDISLDPPVAGSPARGKSCAGSLAVTREKLWLSNYCSGSVQAFNLRTSRFENPIAIGGTPTGMVSDGTRLWVANATKHTVQAIDASTGAIYQETPVSNYPGALALDGRRVWVSTDEGLQALDAETGQVLFSATEGGERPAVTALESVVRPDGMRPTDIIFAAGRLWVAGVGSAVRAIDLSTWSVERVEVGEGLKLFASDGNRLWVGNRERKTLRAIDTKSLSAGRPVSIGTDLGTMAFDGKQLWLAYDGGNVVQPVTVR